MADFFLNGLASYYCWADVETLMFWSFIVGAALPTPLWVIAGVQDWRCHEVSGYVCVGIMLCLAAHAIFFTGWLYLAIIAFCAYIAFRDKEIALVGQADFVMLAHWITAHMTVHNSGVGVFMMASLLFLVCLLVYMLIYRDKDRKRWHRGMMVPVIPPYAVSVVLLALVEWPLSRSMFWKGW